MSRRANDYKADLTSRGLRPAERSGEARSIPIANAAAGGRPDYNASGQATKSAEELAARLQRVKNTQRRINILDAGGATSLANVTTWPDPDYDSTGKINFANFVNLNSGAWAWNDDGTKLFYPDIGDFDGVHTITCTTPYLPDNQTAGGSLEGPQVVPFGQNVLFNADGTSYYQGGYADNSIDRCDMTVAYDPGTGTDASVLTQATECARCSWMAWGVNGETLLIGSGSGNDEIDQYTLATPYEITAADVNGTGKSDATLDLDNGTTVGADWTTDVLSANTFNEDGSELWVFTSQNRCFVFLLSTPGDISSAVYSHRIDSVCPAGYPTGCRFDPASQKLLLAVQGERFWLWNADTLANA